MKKLKSVVASILALSCINFVGCEKGGDSYTVTLQIGAEVYSTMEVNKDSQLSTPAAPTKEGYTFIGWYTDAECTQKYEPSVLSANLTLYAKYEAKQLRISLDLDGGSLEEGVNKYVLVKHNETYSLPVPSKTNYTFVGWEIENEDGTTAEFPASGTYALTSGCFLTAVWDKISGDADEDASTALFVKEGSYFKERASVEDEFTYVFVTGMTYNFSTLTELGIVGGGSAIEQNGLSFKANKAVEDFKLQITKEVDGTEVSYERDAKVVDQVESFDGGADYIASWGVGADRSANFQDANKTVANTTMSVGRNNYVPDMYMLNDSDQVLSWDTAHIQFTVKDDGVETTDYTFANGAFTFGQSIAAGSVVEITYAPKYSLTNQSMKVNVKLNEGVNVYDNAGLRTAYANKDVHEINVLRNIKAEAAPEDLVPGYPNYPINDRDHGVYTRLVVAADEDKITVNGNFFKVDGSNLPYVNNDYSGWNWTETNPAYYIPNVQIGMFLYFNVIDHGAGDLKRYRNNGEVTINDLHVSGNYTKEAGYTVKYGDRELLEQAGAYCGIVLRGGQLTMNNTTVTNTKTGVLVASDHDEVANTYAATLTLVNSKIKHNWGSSLYGWDLTVMNISGSYLGDNSGPAIHIDECPNANTDIETIINMTDTKVENYITGDDAFFTAFDMADTAGMLKTVLETGDPRDPNNPGIAGATQNTCSVIKEINGLQYINLIAIVMSTGSTSDWKTGENTPVDPQGQPTIKFNTTYMFAPQYNLWQGYYGFSNAALGVTDPAAMMLGWVEVYDLYPQIRG